MRSQIRLPYRTDKLQMSSVIFESMVNNLGPRIRRMNFQLHFKSDHEKSAFITAKQRAEKREQAELELDPSDDELEQAPQGEGSPSSRTQLQASMDSIVIEETFEKSILLREHFMARLRNIEERLKVKFMVVPMKVKISACSRDRVQAALDEYRQLQEDICFEPIDRFGRQIFLSRYFKSLLEEKGVHVVEILKKYYFWFLISKVQPKELIQNVFKGTYHALYPLQRIKIHQRAALAAGKGNVVLGQIQFSKNTERLTDQLYTCVRARVFQSRVEQLVNLHEERKDRHVQISQDRKFLIMHMDAFEQQEMLRENIQNNFEKFKFLFLQFPSNVDMKEVQSILSDLPSPSSFKKDKKNNEKDEVFIWQIVKNYICLAFTTPNPQLSSQQIFALHPLTRIINALPRKNLGFRLGVYEMFTLPQGDDWNFLTAQRERDERMTLIGVKNGTKGNYEKLAQLYIDNKLTQEFFKQNKIKIEQVNNSQQGDVSIDLSRQINESTQFLANDLSIKKEEQTQKNQPIPSLILSSEVKNGVNYRFQGYTLLFDESQAEREKKFVGTVLKPERLAIPYARPDYEKQMNQATTFKYKFFRIKLPSTSKNNMQTEVDRILSEKPQLAYLNRWITVFTGGKECKEVQGLCEEGKKVKVIKIEKNHKIKEGFAMKTNPLFIYIQDSDELPSNMYEPTCFMRRVD